jgi:hypothetical protein
VTCHVGGAKVRQAHGGSVGRVTRTSTPGRAGTHKQGSGTAGEPGNGCACSHSGHEIRWSERRSRTAIASAFEVAMTRSKSEFIDLESRPGRRVDAGIRGGFSGRGSDALAIILRHPSARNRSAFSATGPRNFSGASRTAVTFEQRSLWRAGHYHGRYEPRNLPTTGSFTSSGIFSPMHRIGDLSERITFSMAGGSPLPHPTRFCS